MTITIKNSLFEDGKAIGGGGVVVEGPPYSDSQCTNCNHMFISNTQFVGNYAEDGGGAVALYGCIGAELYIDELDFYNNTTPTAGGHITLQITSDQVQFIVVNNSHFESGKALVGGGIFMLAGHSCTPVSSTIHKSVYILNSRIYQNVADVGGGLAVQFNHTCFAIDVLIYSVSLSRNAGINDTGGHIYLVNICAAGNSVTISRSTVEHGYANDSGGGMSIGTNDSPSCPSSMASLTPTNIKIVDSSFQYNTARRMGGALVIIFDSSKYFCCSAKVNITNVTFLNNQASTVPLLLDGEKRLTSGGNIFIEDDTAGQWLNNSVRIHSCLIEGGVAMSGGGIRLLYSIKFAASWQNLPETEGLFISNTRFICNQATDKSYGASLMVESTLLANYSMTLKSLTPINIKKLIIVDSTFDGSCAAPSCNIKINGIRSISYLPAMNNVVFANVSFRGNYTNSLSPLSPWQSSDWSLDDDLKQYMTDRGLYTISPAVQLSYILNATFLDCEFTGSYGALHAVRTSLFFGGNITFQDNKAADGAGLVLVGNSVMHLRPNTHIMFSHNHAAHAGGAIYVQSADLNDIPWCFYQFYEVNQTNYDLSIQILFENNTATFAGSALYGGDVDSCEFYTTSIANYISFESIFKVQNTDDNPSAISSDPYKVCLCDENKPLCSDQNYLHIYKYPGALFQVQAVVVGQMDGIIPGVVLAGLQNTSAVLGNLQQSQFTGKSCTTLNYTVFSPHTVETLILVTKIIPGRLSLEELIINVTLLNCPWGFILTFTGLQTKCDCVEK